MPLLSRCLSTLLLLEALAGCRTPPLPRPPLERQLLIPSGGHPIPGVLVLPGDRKGPVPAVLLLHGFGSHKDEVGDLYRREAAELAARGIASLRIDFPCAGASMRPCTDNTVDVQVAEARTAWEFLLRQPEVAADRAGVLGFSLGGIIAAAVAGEDARVKALVLWSTPADTAEAFRDLRERYGEEAARVGHVTADLGFRTMELSAAFFESTLRSFPLRDIQGHRGPLLLIAGEQDTAIAAGAPRLASSAGGKDTTVEFIPGADHIFGVLGPQDTAALRVLRHTADWLEQKL
jgi:dienelactone hydrolase